ncbi:MAG: S-layer homology domain-containing protein [Clostridia bacterium]|nr:S-layer homology domain-containing protein [Clostridia bacterium]
MKFKWMAVLTLAVSALFTSVAFADDAAFSDVDFSTEQGQAIEKMYNAGYLAGYADGSFKPDATITRAELTRVFNQVFGYELNEENADSMSDFSDVEKGVWYYNDVKIAQSNGYINGFNDGTFRPRDNFTRQQTCVVLSLAAGLESTDKDIVINDEVAPWAEAYVKAAVADGAFKLESGDNFRAAANITRGEVCQALAKFVAVKDDAVTVTKSEAETKTEATTINSSESTTKAESSKGSSGSGSSGSGSSSSGSGGTIKYNTTTEATTEATTKAPDSAVTTETTTEPVTEIVLSADEIKALENVISDTKYVLMYMVKTDNEREVAQYILDAMETYLADNSFDVESAIGEAKSMYNNLEREEKDDFKDCVGKSYNLSDVSKLREVFSAFL